MSSTAAPFGIRPVYHPSGDIRMSTRVDGIASGYNTAIYTGTPIKNHTDGTLIVTTTAAANPTLGSFAGCQYTKAGRRYIQGYWPANETYTAGTMVAQYYDDPEIIYEGQGVGSYAATAVGEGVNLQTSSDGSIYTQQSNQSLSAVTGAVAATFTIVGLADYPDNAWDDDFTIVRVRIQTYQGPVA